MRHTYKLFLIGTCFLLSTAVFSQKKEYPGSIELLTGEKLRGLIKANNWETTPRQIAFRQGPGATEQVFTPLSIKSFTIADTTYVGHIVWIDKLPVSRQDAKAEGTEANVRDSVFLKLLVTGPRVSLYELKDEKTHFYIQQPGGDVVELGYKVFRRVAKKDGIQGRDNFVEHPIFKNQLRSLAFSDESLQYKIDYASYTLADMIKFASAINAIPEKLPYEKAVRRIAVGGGYTSNSFQFSGSNEQRIDKMEANSSGGYIVKVNADFFSKRKFRNLFIRAEANYTHFDFAGHPPLSGSTLRTADYYLIINTVGTTASLAYNIVHSKDFQLYTGVGTGVNISSYPRNIVTSTNNPPDKMEVKKVWMETVNARAGLNFSVINLEFTYRLAGDPFNYSYMRSRYNTFATSLGICFRY